MISMVIPRRADESPQGGSRGRGTRAVWSVFLKSPLCLVGLLASLRGVVALLDDSTSNRGSFQ
jgi:hypothetical protein